MSARPPSANPLYAVILAGGRGTRFWPRSRRQPGRRRAGAGPWPALDHRHFGHQLDGLDEFRGDRGKVKELVRRFRDDISVTSECQIKRLRLICKTDAFLNAFAKTQVIAEILALDPENLLDVAIKEFASRPGL